MRRPGVRLALIALGLAAATAVLAGPARATTQTFSYSNGEQPFVVPADVFNVTITAIGGHGATGASNGAGTGGVGGNGAWIRAADIPVVPGTELYIDVGGDGGATADGVTLDPGNPGNPGGFPNAAPGGTGGGFTPVRAGGGGGGATVVSQCVLAMMCTPIVVAGGGGGGGSTGQGAAAGENGGTGGDAGLTAGGTGAIPTSGGVALVGSPGTAGDTDGDTAITAAEPGQDGTDTGSGVGGAGGGTGGPCTQGGQSGKPTVSGTSRSGGAGGAPISDDAGGGGGGGGGWFGGGGGGAGAVDACPSNGGSGAGGGGGSSFAPAAGDFLGVPTGPPSATIDYTAEQSPATTVAVSFAPKTSLTANGTDQTTVTATVTDGNGNVVPGENVTFKSSNAVDVIGPVTDNHDGTYTATLLASTIAGTDTITATDTNANISGTGQITETPGPPANVRLTLSPAQIPADGSSQTTATAVVTDQYGNTEPTGGDTLQFTSTDPHQAISIPTDHGNGTYTATITSSTTLGTWTITAIDLTQHSISGTASLATPGPPTTVTLQLTPSTLAADGTSSTSAVATVNDSAGDGIAGQAVQVTSSDPNQKIGTVTDNHNGTYTVTVTASTTAGKSTLTATDTSAATSLRGSAMLTETAGPPAALSIVLSPPQIDADRRSTTYATATIVDQFGNPDGSGGDTITFSTSDPGQHIGAVTDDHDGSYSVPITASGTAGPSSISAVDSTMKPNLSGLATLIELARRPPTPPTITHARTSNRVFVAGRGHRTHGVPVGTTLSFTLSQPATVALSIASQTAGRRVGTSCVRPTALNAHHRRCTRLVPAGSLSATGHTGTNTVPFNGVLRRHKRLLPGRYALTLVATNAAGVKSKPATVTFKVVPAAPH